MGSKPTGGTGPDLTRGFDLGGLREGEIFEGHVGDETVIVVRKGDDVLAVSGTCTHYGAPLSKGLLQGETIRCPWHHACFSLRTGEALRAPAFDPIECWSTTRRGNRVFVEERVERARPVKTAIPETLGEIVIIGGGAAGFAAAEMLRRRGFGGHLAMLSADTDAPYDRPNLSKDYLAGDAPEEWIPLRSSDFYRQNEVDLNLGTTAIRIDSRAGVVSTVDGRSFHFDRLLLAPGAEPATLPATDHPNVFTLRSLADSRAIIERAKTARSAVVLGAGFIGLEVAAALRARGIEVQVVAPDRQPLEKVLGLDLGRHVRSLHERHGVVFHLEDVVSHIKEDHVTLAGGDVLDADLIVVAIGVTPRTLLAKSAGIATGEGILVDEYLETSVPGIFAAGDAAEWLERASGTHTRSEHWVVAQRQGQVAACNMLGERRVFADAPFFWSAHYETSIRFVGHSRHWDSTEIEGDLEAGEAVVRYRSEGKVVAVAAIGQDREALNAAVSLEQGFVAG
ncbi:FAD-dependent oxidoreductase [Nitratireductor mangrovi]|uniref:FAD-dependent oxidoreductase n=1 Tax=Nitratireductor mangrovi TaxID=2599600 RepID=A0A5B8KVF8_9HYPH|nr:FAD-dependent oxidoreductase [Nitratireductor mangrovi]QDY99594.1 FAD-dependent oxidoreductase [Nitratireductor mangrovi]